MIEGVRGDNSKEVMEERNEREEPKIGGNQRKNLSSMVKKLKPIENLTFSLSCSTMSRILVQVIPLQVPENTSLMEKVK